MADNLMGRDREFEDHRPHAIPWIDALIRSTSNGDGVLNLPDDRRAKGTLETLPEQLRIDNQGYFKAKPNDNFGWYNLQIQLNIHRKVSQRRTEEQLNLMLILTRELNIGQLLSLRLSIMRVIKPVSSKMSEYFV
jgi:hypothetical protein